MTEQQLNELPSSIERGVLFLDTLYGNRDWLKAVDLETLNMQYLDKDLLAQVSGLEDIGYSEYFSLLEMIKLNPDARLECGFEIPKDADDSDYTLLTQLWKDKINALRRQDIR